jgi:hypothetical protein
MRGSSRARSSSRGRAALSGHMLVAHCGLRSVRRRRADRSGGSPDKTDRLRRGQRRAARGRCVRSCKTVEPTMVMIDAQTVRGGRAGPTFHNAGGRGGRTIGAKRSILIGSRQTRRRHRLRCPRALRRVRCGPAARREGDRNEQREQASVLHRFETLRRSLRFRFRPQMPAGRGPDRVGKGNWFGGSPPNLFSRQTLRLGTTSQPAAPRRRSALGCHAERE